MSQKTKKELEAARDQLLRRIPQLHVTAAVSVSVTLGEVRVMWHRRAKNRPELPKKVDGVPVTSFENGRAQASSPTVAEIRAAREQLMRDFPNLLDWAFTGIAQGGVKVGWQRKGKDRPKLPKEVAGVPILAEWVGPIRALAAVA